MPTVDLTAALAAFAHGFAHQRSRTHPFLAERVGPLWLLRDAPRRRGDYRREEFIACGQPAAEVDALARAHTRGRYVVCALQAGEGSHLPLRDEYKALGYRLATTEPLMVHDLESWPTVAAPDGVEVARVTTPTLCALVNAAAGRVQLPPDQLGDDAPRREWVALSDGAPVGWLGSIAVPGGETWCSDLYVVPAQRRRGLARALLARMLADDRERGARGAVLLASHTGALVYPSVGYRQLGVLLLLNPPRG